MRIVPIEEAPAGIYIDCHVQRLLARAWKVTTLETPIEYTSSAILHCNFAFVVNELVHFGARFTRSRIINGIDSPLRTTVYVLDKGVWWADGHDLDALALACCRAYCAINGVKEIEVG